MFLFFSSEQREFEGEGGEQAEWEGDFNYNEVFHSHAAELCTWVEAVVPFFFYSVNKVENEKEEEENKENGKGITTTMQSSTAMQQRCTGCQGICFFPVNEEGEGEGGRGGGGGGGR